MPSLGQAVLVPSRPALCRPTRFAGFQLTKAVDDRHNKAGHDGAAHDGCIVIFTPWMDRPPIFSSHWENIRPCFSLP
jgi:hypothetical protein